MSGGAYRRPPVRTIGPVQPPEPASGPGSRGDDPEDPDPGVPSGSVVVLAFLGVVVAGVLGALAAYGIVDVDCQGSCGTNSALAAVVGALVGTIGGRGRGRARAPGPLAVARPARRRRRRLTRDDRPGAAATRR